MSLSDEERKCARLKFLRSLRFLQHFEAYLVPSIGGIVTRSVDAQREFCLPFGSRSIGIYRMPASDGPLPVNDPTHRKAVADLADSFLGDLDDVVAKLDAERRTAAA